MAKKTTKRASEDELLFDIRTHILVPKHELCSDAECKRVLAQFGATTQQLPRILINDPAVKPLGAKQGDVIKITRASPTAGETLFYRIVTVD